MKKKNSFRPEDFKYEPVEQPKLPLWMHSVERPATDHEKAGVVKTAVFILASGMLLALAYLIVG